VHVIHSQHEVHGHHLLLVFEKYYIYILCILLDQLSTYYIYIANIDNLRQLPWTMSWYGILYHLLDTSWRHKYLRRAEQYGPMGRFLQIERMRSISMEHCTGPSAECV